MYLNAVQVLELVERSDERSAESFGFGAESGGYVAPEGNEAIGEDEIPFVDAAEGADF